MRSGTVRKFLFFVTVIHQSYSTMKAFFWPSINNNLIECHLLMLYPLFLKLISYQLNLV